MRAVAPLLFLLCLSAQDTHRFKTYVENLPRAEDSQTLLDQLMMIGDDEFEQTPSSEIAEALPTLDRILKSGGSFHRSAVALTLFGIVRRADGSQLLKDYVPDIVASLRDPNRGVAAIAILTLTNLRPAPVELVVPKVLPQVTDETLDDDFRAVLTGLLARYSPYDPRVIAAISHFSHEKHIPAVRAQFINGIALVCPASPEFVSMIIEAIETDPETRFTSVQALERCSSRYADIAVPVLAKVAQDNAEKPEVRDMAAAAIRSLRRNP